MQGPRRRVPFPFPGKGYPTPLAALNDPDDFSDLDDVERLLPDPIDLSKARPARRCDCPDVLYDAEDPYNRLVCGRLLPGEVADAA